MSKGSIRDSQKPVKKVSQTLLTKEKREELQAKWNEEAKDLLNRDGDSQKYPKHFIKHDPKLQAVIQDCFEGFIERFLEREYPHPKPRTVQKSSVH